MVQPGQGVANQVVSVTSVRQTPSTVASSSAGEPLLTMTTSAAARRSSSDAWEATRRLAGRPGGPVVLLLSTYDVDQVDIEGSGAAAYLPKAELGPDRLSSAWREARGRLLGHG